MAEPPDSETPVESATALEGGAYDLIKQRLSDQGSQLREKLGALDTKRAEVFGSRKLELKKMDRVSTLLSCEPRDMIQLGHNRFLLGFKVDLGLKQGQLSDVFAVYQFDETEETFREGDMGILENPEISSENQLFRCQNPDILEIQAKPDFFDAQNPYVFYSYGFASSGLKIINK